MVPGGAADAATTPTPALVPQPVSIKAAPGPAFTLTKETRIVVAPHSAAAKSAAKALAAILRPSTGYPLPVTRQARATAGQPRCAAEGRWPQGARHGGVPARRLGRHGEPDRTHRGRALPRRADLATAAAAARGGEHRPARAVDHRRRAHHRPSAVRLARSDARRVTALLRRRRGQALHRPARHVQGQRAAPAPRRRPGLADPDRQLAPADDVRRQHRGRRRTGRLLHEGAVRAS